MPGSDFYIGYRPKAPRTVALVRALVIVALTVLAVAAMIALAWYQEPQPGGVFEYGTTRTFEGVLYEYPIPSLRMASTQGRVVSDVLLVNRGKFGLPEYARGRDGSRVRFDGKLIFKDRTTMIEMGDANRFEVLEKSAPQEARTQAEDGRSLTLTGELVDTKCYLGAMRPAEGKVHRACAVRCLSGGVPPGLLHRDLNGESRLIMLSGPNGKTLDFDVQWAGTIIRVTGDIDTSSDWPTMFVESMDRIVEVVEEPVL